MKASLAWGTALACVSAVSGFGMHDLNHINHIYGGEALAKRQLGRASRSSMPHVPVYNFSMPVDHFNESDQRVFNNRYFVNDTYYKEGGPVIFFDFGEGGVDAGLAAGYLAEWRNISSAPILLAKELNGVVIGWEHRYYGYSQPFPLTDADSKSHGLSYSEMFSGIPTGGAADYKYLTIDQSLEDVAYFAKNFNQTKLGVNNTVLSGDKATEKLGPYHTPWIWVGASYPGNRGVWTRMRNPEVFYAVWASSAPVDAKADGSAYFNSIYRAIPKNCSSDMQAAAAHLNEVFSGSDAAAQRAVKMGTAVALGYEGAGDETLGQVLDVLDAGNITQYLFSSQLTIVQGYGVSRTMQKFCDHLELFNVDQFLANSSVASSDLEASQSVFLYNDGDAKPSDGGIAAAHESGAGGLTGQEISFAALLYAVYSFQRDLVDLLTTGDSLSTSITPWADLHSWEWQVLAEIGLVVSFNTSSPLVLGPQFYGLEEAREQMGVLFGTIPAEDLPGEANLTYPQTFQGWDARPSNVMWTNGEFDPWRAFSVMSLDQDLGAPSRKVTQDIPACNKAPAGTDVFGLLFPGAVHAEDMAYVSSNPRGSEEAKHPVDQGLELFLSAYKAWEPCFAESRAQVNSGASDPTPGTSGSGGGGDDKNAGFSLRPSVGAWQAAALMGAAVAYQLL